MGFKYRPSGPWGCVPITMILGPCSPSTHPNGHSGDGTTFMKGSRFQSKGSLLLITLCPNEKLHINRFISLAASFLPFLAYRHEESNLFNQPSGLLRKSVHKSHEENNSPGSTALGTRYWVSRHWGQNQVLPFMELTSPSALTSLHKTWKPKTPEVVVTMHCGKTTQKIKPKIQGWWSPWMMVQDHSPSIPGTKYVKGVGTSQPFSAFLADCHHLCTESNSSNCLTNEQAGGQCGQCWKEVLLKNWTKWRKTLLVIVGFFLINWDDLAEKLEF